jgi:hypothetical protein
MALDRHKKNKFEGFKNFVETLEGTPAATRTVIFLNGLLEDPNYMMWAMRNVKTFKDYLDLPSDEVEACFKANPNSAKFVAKLLFKTPELETAESIFRRQFSQIKEELEATGEVTDLEREASLISLLKTVRKLSKDGRVNGFKWTLPDEAIFFDKSPREGKHQINYENGVLAAKGEMLKGKRQGKWEHFFETGKILARGDYDLGLKSGDWEIYYSTEKIRSSGKYRQDVRHGTWKEFSRDGNETVIEYVEGKKVA